MFKVYILTRSAVVTYLVNCSDIILRLYYLKIGFRNARHINSLSHCKDMLHRSLKSKVVYKASCSRDCDNFYMDETKRRLHDRKTEHFKAPTKSCQASAIADHITSTGHNIKWDNVLIFTNREFG